MTDPVLVIGGGIIGLTVAVTLAEAGRTVHVQTAETPADTTSAVAGALWGPWLAEPQDRVQGWARTTLAELTRLATDDETGVRLVAGKEISHTENEPPYWTQLLPDWRTCTPDELPPHYSHGSSYTAPLVTMPTHLRYLTSRLTRAGGTIEIKTIHHLHDATSTTPIVINCSGIGARKLANDPLLHPVRGQQLIVTNPGITEFTEVDNGNSTDLTAIYPHPDHLVLSGTAEPEQWDRTPDPTVADGIMRRCVAVDSRLTDARIIEHRVGLRPQRSQVRLETDTTEAGVLIHNYGHGGAGVSLAWGCAQEVAMGLDRLGPLEKTEPSAGRTDLQSG
jgi:D-amino-acid oxidase